MGIRDLWLQRRRQLGHDTFRGAVMEVPALTEMARVLKENALVLRENAGENALMEVRTRLPPALKVGARRHVQFPWFALKVGRIRGPVVHIRGAMMRIRDLTTHSSAL